jgi:prevent-host-death family protein
MTVVSIDDAQTRLPELLSKLAPGEEVLIVQNNEPIGRLIGCAKRTQRRLGSLKGTVVYVAPDFDGALPDMQDYTE